MFSKVIDYVYSCEHEIRDFSQNFNIDINYKFNDSEINYERIKNNFKCKECINKN